MALITSCPSLQVSWYQLAAGVTLPFSSALAQQAHITVQADLHVHPYSSLFEKTSMLHLPALGG